MNFTIRKEFPNPKEWMTLRSDAGWVVFSEEQAIEGQSRSLFSVTAKDDQGRLIGCARVVGDGIICFYIQDVVVLQSFQRQGVGRAIMKEVMAEIQKRAISGSMVGLMSAYGKEDFYESLGFIRRPNDHLGSGMWLRLKMEEIFNG